MNNRPLLIRTGSIFDLAASAYKRSHSEISESLTSILFSFIGLESFINTLIEIISEPCFDKKIPSKVITLDKILTELDTSNLNIATKFQITRLVLSGDSYDKGASPYQDFDCLIKIRNDLIHSKPVRITMQTKKIKPPKEYPNFIRHLTSKGIIPKPKLRSSWESLITVPKVAYWSYKTAYEMIISLIEVFPKCSIKRMLSMLIPSLELLNNNNGKDS